MASPAALKSQSLPNIIVLVILALLWSSSFPAIKIAVDTTGPITLVAVRSIVGLCLVLGFALVLAGFQRGILWRSYLSYLPRIFVMSTVGMSLPFYLISRAELVLEASLTGLLMSVGPLMTITGAHFFLKNERMSVASFAGVMTGFAGIVVLLGRGAAASSGATIDAQILVVMATACYVVANLMARKMPEVPAVFLTIAMLSFTALQMIPLALYFEAPDPSSWSPTIWSSAIWLGLFPTGIAFLLRFYLIKRAGAGFTSYVGYLIPMFSVVLGTLLLGELLSAEKMIAVLLVVSGLAISQRGKS